MLRRGFYFLGEIEGTDDYKYTYQAFVRTLVTIVICEAIVYVTFITCAGRSGGISEINKGIVPESRVSQED